MLSPPPQPTLGEVGGAAGRIPCRPPPSAVRGSEEDAVSRRRDARPAGGSKVRRLQELSPALYPDVSWVAMGDSAFLDEAQLAAECAIAHGGLRPHEVQSLRIVPEVVADRCRSTSTGAVVVLALDGVNHRAPRRAWSQARREALTSTFPTSSVVAWL